MPVYAHIEPLPWESDFFQQRSAKLLLAVGASPLTVSDLQPFQRVQAKIPAQQVTVVDELAALGFQLVEGEVDLALSCAPIADVDRTQYQIRLATQHDIPMLQQVAADVFALSRFRPPWYQPLDSGRFYATWATNAVLGTFDTQCLLLETRNGQPCGFVTLRETSPDTARIGLLAAWPGVSRQGIGTQLMAAAKRWCQQRQRHQLWVATQMSNIAALRLYMRSGASIVSTAYWLYR